MSEKIKLFEIFAQPTQRPPTWKTADIELRLSAAESRVSGTMCSNTHMYCGNAHKEDDIK